MIFSDYIFLILNCRKYRKKAEKQKKGWLSKLSNDFLYFHIIGDQYLKTDYIMDIPNHILYVKCKDDYISLPKKVLCAIKAFNETITYKYIFKTDDDITLLDMSFLDKLKNILEKYKYDYGGRVVNVCDHYTDYWKVRSVLPKNLFLNKATYCCGRFYFLSKRACEDLISKKEIEKYIIEDHAIGYLLDKKIRNNIYDVDTYPMFV